MQPDLPDPVVPAIRRCGIRARSVQTALPEMSFPSQHRERARLAGHVPEDVAEGDELRRQVRNLDADRLLARDRRQDPDLGRRERVGEVVLEAGHLRDLRPRRELQLVAHDARPRDLADDRRVDAEVRERARQLLRDLRARGAVVARHGRRGFSSARSGSRYSPPAGTSKSIPSAFSSVGVRSSRRRRRRDERRRLGGGRDRCDHVGIALGGVDGRALPRRRGPGSGSGSSSAAEVERPPGRRARLPHGVAGAAQQRAGRGAGEEERAGDEAARRRR